MKPRLALVAPSLDILGGQGVAAEIMVRRLRADGYDVRFVPINPRFVPPLRWLRRVRYVRSLLNEALYVPSLQQLREVDVVHVFSASYWSFMLAVVPALIVAKALGKRTVLHYHSGEAFDHLARWGSLVHPWLRLCDRIVVPSHYLRGVFEAHHYRVEVIPNAVDVERFSARVRQELRPRLLSTRNLERHYGVDDTLHAFALVHRARPDATLTIVGDGSERLHLQALAAALGCVDAVRFAGSVPHGRVDDYYRAAHVFLNASWIDNQPLSVIEAFAAGLPVITTGTGDIGNLVRAGETGTLVPPRAPAAMAAAINRVLEAPAPALAMAERAQRDLARFSWASVREGWARVYTEVAA